MNLRFRLLAFLFAGLLVLPTLDQMTSLSARFQSTENRRLDNRPSLNGLHLRGFVRSFDQYYKENFGGRNALFYLYSRWKLRVLKTSPLPEKVVVGNDGWFYLGNSYNRVVDQHRGLLPLSPDSARIIARHLARRQAELGRQGIRLYVLIAPDSHAIYPEHLPDNLKPGDYPPVTRLAILKQAIERQTTVPFIDLLDTLRRAKNLNAVYYQTDTHWNDYGTLVGSAALLKCIRADIPMLQPVIVTNYTIQKQRGAGGDLVNMLTFGTEIKDPVYYDIKPVPVVTARQTATIPDPQGGFPATRFVGPDARQPKLLFIGDSFSHSMMPVVAGYFRESYFVRSNQLDAALVQAEKPTVVVVEIVERNLGWLVNL